jgi:hypothetical protein
MAQPCGLRGSQYWVGVEKIISLGYRNYPREISSSGGKWSKFYL